MTTAAAAVAVGGNDADLLVCWRGGDTEDSFESEALRRDAISTVAVRVVSRPNEKKGGR